MQILEGLLKLPENRECADCGSKYAFQKPSSDISNNITVSPLLICIIFGGT